MIYYYVIRDVPHNGPNPTSYPRGRTLIGVGYRTRAEAENRADKFNRFRAVDTFSYVVNEHDDLSTDRDYFDFYSHT